ncbi:MAG: lamin tail domain-containing protein [Verrucomicrobiales bacterium]
MNRSYFALLLALALMQGALHAQDPFPISVAIHEIHYHPNLPTESVEFIELYNPTDSEIDLSGWSFSEGIDHVFSAGEMIGANTLYLLAQDAAAYNKKFGSIFTGGVKANVQWDAGMLSNTGETLTLRNAANKIIDQVDYQDGFPWPVSADGGGASMELVNALEDNGLSGHWRASVKPTPGKENAMRLENPPPAVRQVAHAPKAPTASDTVVVSAKATDADGVASMILALQVITPGSYIRLTDDAYATSWEMFPMNDAGTDGDDGSGRDDAASRFDSVSDSRRGPVREHGRVAI